MGKILKQFRYYGKNNSKNYPKSTTGSSQDGISAENLRNGSIFGTDSILRLGVQGLPGTKFYLNGSLHPMILDASGIFSLEVKNGARINTIHFGDKDFDEKKVENSNYEDSISQIDNIKNDFAYLIVDILAEEKED